MTIEQITLKLAEEGFKVWGPCVQVGNRIVTAGYIQRHENNSHSYIFISNNRITYHNTEYNLSLALPEVA